MNNLPKGKLQVFPRSLKLLLKLTLFLVASLAVSAQSLEILGDFIPLDLSHDGSVVLGEGNQNGARTLVVHREDSLDTIWSPPAFNTTSSTTLIGESAAISGDGKVVYAATRVFNKSDQSNRVQLIRIGADGSVVNLPDLPAPNIPNTTVFFKKVNEDGTVALATTTDPKKLYQWDETGVSQITLPDNFYLFEVDSSLTRILGFVGFESKQMALWTEGQPLRTFGESSPRFFPIGITPDGRKIAGNYFFGSEEFNLASTRTVIHDLETGAKTEVITTGFQRRPHAIDCQGRLYGGLEGQSNLGSDEMWTEDDGWRDLSSALTEDYGLGTAGWRFGRYWPNTYGARIRGSADCQTLIGLVSQNSAVNERHLDQLSAVFRLQFPLLQEVSLGIKLTEEDLEVGDETTATVTAFSNLPEPVTITLNDPLLTTNEAGFVQIGEIDAYDPFVLSPENTKREFSVPIRILKKGTVDLVASGIAVETGGEEKELNATFTLALNPINTKITVTSTEHLLNLTPEEEWSEKAQQLNNARRAAELEPYQNLIEIKLEITNGSEEILENVNIPAALNALSMVKSIDLSNPAVPLNPIQLIVPDETTYDLTEPNNGVSIDGVELPPDETVTFTWIFDAYDVDPTPNVDNSAELEFEALILAGLDLATVRTLAEDRFSVIDQPLLEWGINLVKSGASFLSGEPVEVEGILENISADNGGEGHTLIVALIALTEGNLGGGWLRDPETSVPGGQFFELFELTPEGENKTKSLRGVFQSFPTLINSAGEIEYEIRLWIKEAEDELKAAHARKKLKSNLQDALVISLASNSTLFYAQPIQQTVGLPSLLSNLSGETIANFAAAGSDLIDYLFDAKEEMGYLNQSIAAQDLDLKNRIYRELNLDGEELERILSRGYDTYVQLAKFNILPGGTIVNRQEYADACRQELSSFLSTLQNEPLDLNAMKDRFETYHNNAQQLTFPYYLFMNGIQAISLESLDPASTSNRIIREKRKRLRANVAQRIEAARNNPVVKSITEVFEPGDILKASSLFSSYGLNLYQYQRLQEIAAENDVIISFRSATQETRQLLKTANAIPTPSAWPLLAVNNLDVLYLGFEQTEKGKVTLMRPPEEVLGIAGEALSTAITSYVDKLAASKSELRSNVVLLSEVKNRLRARVQEWTSFGLERVAEGAEELGLIPANYSQSLDTVKGVLRDGAKQFGAERVYRMTTETLPDRLNEVTGEIQKRWQLFLEDPIDSANAKQLINSIEFLPPLDPSGHIIKNEDRLRQIYSQLSVIPGFNHLSIYSEVREDALGYWQACCGDEPVVTIAPSGDQAPVVAFLRESLSVLQGGSNANLIQLVPPAGPPGPDILLTAPTVIKAVRDQVSDEFVFLEGALYQAKVDLGYENSFSAKTWLESLKDYLDPYTPYLPSLLGELLEADTTEFSRDEGAPIIQPTGDFDNEGNPLLQVWTEVSGWLPISVTEALELGVSGKADFAPMTTLPEGGEAGDTRVEITPQAILGAVGEFFLPGDRVVINPGGYNEEIATVQGEGSLIFTSPLKYDHSIGELVAFLGPDEMDLDGDGLNGIQEAQAGTDSQNPDTDGDGIHDGMEVDLGQDPLTPISGYRITSINTQDMNNNPSVSFTVPANHSYEVEASTTLNEEDWIEVISGEGINLPTLQSTEFENWFPDSDRVFYRIRYSEID